MCCTLLRVQGPFNLAKTLERSQISPDLNLSRPDIRGIIKTTNVEAWSAPLMTQYKNISTPWHEAPSCRPRKIKNHDRSTSSSTASSAMPSCRMSTRMPRWIKASEMRRTGIIKNRSRRCGSPNAPISSAASTWKAEVVKLRSSWGSTTDAE